MKRISVFLWIVLFFPACVLFSQKPAKSTLKKYKVSGRITKTEPFCGGARPTEEMLAQMNTPQPYLNKVLYVRAGKVNSVKKPILLKFKADSAGNFTFELPPGDYAILQEEQVKKLNYKVFPSGKDYVINKPCAVEWWKKPYQLLVIKDSDVSGLTINFDKKCFIPVDINCIDYVGPMPP